MSQVGFEPRIRVFERTKTVHALDRAATVTGTIDICSLNIAPLFLVETLEVKEYEMGRARSTNGEKRNAYRILVGKPEEITRMTNT
jgi:hypothetical protein